jgi:hypothetical protein
MATEINNNDLIIKDLSASNLVIGPNALANSFYVSENGNVGINTDTPEEALTVDGNLSLSGDLFVTGNSTIGQLLEVNVIRANTYLNLSGESIQRAITNLTYTQLTGNISAGTLQSGELYRITDFVTEYISNAGEWISPSNSAFITANSGTPVAVSAIAATPEPLIVLALSSNKIGSYAYSEVWPYDTIIYDPNLTLLTNRDDTYRSKGFITYREDTINRIACDYDWRNVRFKRWILDPLSGTNPILPWLTATSYAQFDLVTSSSIVYVCLSAHTSAPSFATDYNSGRWIGVFGINGGLLHRPDGLQIQNASLREWIPITPIGTQNLTLSPKLTAVYGGAARAGYFSTFANPVNGNNSVASYVILGACYNIRIRKGSVTSNTLNNQGFSTTLSDITFSTTLNSQSSLIDIDIQTTAGGNNSSGVYDSPNVSNSFYRIATGLGSGNLIIRDLKVTDSGSFTNNAFRVGTGIRQVEINPSIGGFRNNFGTLERLYNTRFTENVINNIFDQNIINNNINGEFHSNFIQNGFYDNNINNNLCSNILNRNFQNNTISAPVSTVTFNNLLTATHIYRPYNCNIIANTNLETKLTYLTNTGSITAVNIND